MTRLVFATRNQGKVVELAELLSGIEVEVVSLRDLPAVPDVVEDASTFAGNAIKKAREVALATGLPALADDSGLEVDELGGAPGVHSARYAGEPSDDAANNRKLLAALAGIPPERRSARFRCVVAFADPRGRLGDAVLVGDGMCEGIVLEAPRGSGGFGYDPLFFSPELGMTFAEAGVGKKSGLSHRARAMRALVPKVAEYFEVAKQPRGG